MRPDGSGFVLNAKADFSLDPGKHNVRLILKNSTKSEMIQTPEITCRSFKVLSAKIQYNVAKAGICPFKVWETVTFRTTAPG